MMMRTIRSHGIRFAALLLLLAGIPWLLSACGSAYPDYSSSETYRFLFSEDDAPEDTELKNALIEHIEAYNKGNPEKYYALFDMTRDDLAFNIANFKTLSQTCRMSYTLLSIDTAFINEDHAQALLNMEAKGTDAATGEILYHYRRVITYTLEKKGKTFIVKEQSDEEMAEDYLT